MKIAAVEFVNSWRDLRHIGKQDWYEYHLLAFGTGFVDHYARVVACTFAVMGIGVRIHLDYGFAQSSAMQVVDRAAAKFASELHLESAQGEQETVEEKP